MDEPLEKVFRLRRLFCVIAWIFVLVTIAKVGLILHLSLTEGLAGHPSMVEVYVGTAIPTLFLVYHWRMRIDAVGVHRRRFLRWRTYRWDEFKQRGVAPAKDYSGFVFPNRRWGETKLSAATLSDEDGEYLLTRCFEAWEAPTQIEIPPVLEINDKGDSFPHRLLHFDASGVTVRKRKRYTRFAWSEIAPIVFYRHRGQTVGFTMCEIPIPGGSARLSARTLKEQLRGPDPQIIAAFLERHVPADRILYVHPGQPESVAEVEVLIDRLQARYRDACRSRLPFIGLSLGGSVALLLYSMWVCGQPFDWMLHSGVIYLGGMGVIVAFALPRLFRGQLEDLQRRREQLLNESPRVDESEKRV
ncbi:MAG: hypothetical protein IT364_12310 [Candidatus Hydrogenedentes bacterium]|nr:hypothetical protein [Candidatus Hydrogenedentota bacterium]